MILIQLCSLHLLASRKFFIIVRSQTPLVFAHDAQHSLRPALRDASLMSVAHRCAGFALDGREPFAPRTSPIIGKNSMLAQTNLQKKEIRSLARSFFPRNVMRHGRSVPQNIEVSFS